MLKHDDHKRLAEVAAATPMGELFRRFWIPALLEEEVSQSGGPPVEVHVLGEKLIAFRDTTGKVALIDAFCPHRKAPMLLGRNEDAGIRCVYHGWKFDGSGQCIDMPNEPADSTFKDKISIKSYPTNVAGGVVWTYMGPADRQPDALPALEWSRLNGGHVMVSKTWQYNNWAQAVEGGIDSSHVAFLHREGHVQVADQAVEPSSDADAVRTYASRMAADTAPRFYVKPLEQDAGLWVGARRNNPTGDDAYYWRITPFLLPFYTIVPPTRGQGDVYRGHAWVPIDDENTWTYNISWRRDRPFTDDEVEYEQSVNGNHFTDETYIPVANQGNQWLIDRELQRTSSYTGISNSSRQDRAVQEGMGSLVDRTTEHLGTTDVGIIAFRRLMLRVANELAAGHEPTAPMAPGAYNVRSISTTLNESEDFLSALSVEEYMAFS